MRIFWTALAVAAAILLAGSAYLALAIVSAHQGGATLAFTYRAEWPHADATR